MALGLVVLLLATGIGLFFWARSVLSTDNVRTTLAKQLSKILGQPVVVQGVSATIYPRITVRLTGVAIGTGSEITLDALDVGTDVRALLSRRIEAATLRIDGAHLSLPLPPIAFGGSGGSTPAEGSGAPPVQLGSVDAVVLTNIQIVSRGRTLRGDIDIVPHGTSALTIRKMALVADGAPTPSAPIGSTAVDLTVTLAAERATMGGISLEAVWTGVRST